MTISTRKPAVALPNAPVAKKSAPTKPAAKKQAATKTAAKNPAARAAPAAAAKTAVTPPIAPSAAIASTTPPNPVNKEKRIRTSFAFPESQVALLGELKKRCLGFGVNVKKGELLTAGLQLLKLLPETALESAVLPSLRSHRQPNKKKKQKK